MKHALGTLLKEAREQNHLSQAELGQLLGIEKRTLSKTETGERPLLASELLTASYIFGDTLECQIEAQLSEVIADLVARLREFIGAKTFAPDEFTKRDWLKTLLARLDGPNPISFA